MYPVQQRDEKGVLMENEDGTPKIVLAPYSIGTLTVKKDTIKGIYKGLKRSFRNGEDAAKAA